MRTGVIKYNIKDRGREHRGQPRRFDSVGLAAVVNSNEVQERVKHGDLWGYLEHWPRKVFGMSPGAGGVVQSGPLAGKVIRLEPAFVTRSLEADTSGNVRHEAEFADTPFGRTAARLFNNKKGGFSSAIDCRTRNGVDVPIGFYGFDYVSEPNYSTNRGYALDGVMEGADEASILDSAIVESLTTVQVLDSINRALQGDYDRMADAFSREVERNQNLHAENRELIALLAKKSPELAARLDSIVSGGFSRPLRTNAGSAILDLAQAFGSMELGQYEPRETAPPSAEESKLHNIVQTFRPRVA